MLVDDNAPWTEYRRLVIGELERLNDGIRELNIKIDTMRHQEIHVIWIELNRLQMKAGVWGAMAGLIPVLLALGLMWLSKKGAP